MKYLNVRVCVCVCARVCVCAEMFDKITEELQSSFSELNSMESIELVECHFCSIQFEKI